MIVSRKLPAAFALLCAIAANLPAQSIYATLTGVVSDPSQGLVAQATVRLRDEGSGSLRDTVTNSQGYYTFASVPVGTYELTVVMTGFETYKESGIALGGGEKRNVNVNLKVGSATETVMVTGTADLLAPVDSGEKSSTLTVKQLENFVQVGSNAAEFIKMMPGFGIQNGTANARELQRGHHRHQCQRQRRKPEPAEQRLRLQRPPQQHAGHHGRRGARFRPRLQLRHAGQSQRGYDRRVQNYHVQLQRRKPEGSGGAQLGG